MSIETSTAPNQDWREKTRKVTAGFIEGGTEGAKQKSEEYEKEQAKAKEEAEKKAKEEAEKAEFQGKKLKIETALNGNKITDIALVANETKKTMSLKTKNGDVFPLKNTSEGTSLKDFPTYPLEESFEQDIKEISTFINTISNMKKFAAKEKITKFYADGKNLKADINRSLDKVALSDVKSQL
jgi:hypothetical protein